MKQNNGVTMMSLIITILVMIILVTIVLSSGMTSINETVNTKNEMEIRNLKDAVAARMINNEKNPEKYPLIGNTIDDLAGFLNYVDNLSEADVEKITKNLTEDNMKYYKIINYQEASQLGVDSVAKTHYYIIDYLAGNVYGPIDIDEMSSEANP